MAWKVVVSPSAIVDLENIVSYIARHNRTAAEKLGNLLITRAEGLEKFPEMGRIVPEYQDTNLREVVVRSYRVIYRLRPPAQSIEIIRFWHAARGFPTVPRLNF